MLSEKVLGVDQYPDIVFSSAQITPRNDGYLVEGILTLHGQSRPVIDAQARKEKMNHATRHALRRQHAPPLLGEIRNHILAMSKTVLPKSAAGQACSYTLAIWKRLTRFFDYPELELSNNLAENSMRPIAVGRSNWIHIGSQPAGPRVAAILSVVESCRRLKIPVRDYLADILPGLASAPIQRIADTTPVAWGARHP
jgi:transposase